MVRDHGSGIAILNQCSAILSGNVTGGGRNVEGAEVSLFQSGNLKVTTQTDAFGDFRFNGIEDGSRGYAVQAYGGAGVTVEAEIPGKLQQVRLSPITRLITSRATGFPSRRCGGDATAS